MLKKGFFSLVLIKCFFFLSLENHAQQQTYSTSADSYITVTGTSTLHDWEMRSENLRGEAVFNKDNNGSPQTLESLTFRLGKTSLKSDKSQLDRRAYQALNSNRHPEIIFRTNGSNSVRKNGDGYSVNARGELTISGTTRRINVDANCINGDDNKLICSGSQKLKMSDFEVDPPVLMLGTLRTGDEITINYRIVYMQ